MPSITLNTPAVTVTETGLVITASGSTSDVSDLSTAQVECRVVLGTELDLIATGVGVSSDGMGGNSWSTGFGAAEAPLLSGLRVTALLFVDGGAGGLG